MDASLWLAPLVGVAIAAACGLRAFLPLLVLGLAARAGLLELHEGARWIAGDLTLIALAVATVLEVSADKVPVVDHALDAVGTVLRPAAAWLGAYAVLAAWPTPWGQLGALAIGSVAVGVHVAKAKLRLGSTATTLGTANPVLSLLEDAVALLLAVVAVLAPLLILLAVLAVVWLARRLRRRAPPSGGAVSQGQPATMSTGR